MDKRLEGWNQGKIEQCHTDPHGYGQRREITLTLLGVTLLGDTIPEGQLNLRQFSLEVIHHVGERRPRLVAIDVNAVVHVLAGKERGNIVFADRSQ